MICHQTDKDEHTTVYPYPQSSELSKLPYFPDYDFMESVTGEMLPVFCVEYRMIIIITFGIYVFW